MGEVEDDGRGEDGDVGEDEADVEVGFDVGHMHLLLALGDIVEVFDDGGDGGDSAEDGEYWDHDELLC